MEGIVMKRISKLVLLAVLVVTVTVFMAVPVMAASKGKLVKEYKYKSYTLKDGAWKNHYSSKTSYKYNKKGDPIKITEKVGKASTSTKYKYTYKKGKKTKAKFSGWTMKYKKGVPVSKSFRDGDGNGRIFDYKFKSRYATFVRFVDIMESDEEGDHDTTLYNFKVTTKKGYPVKISRTDEGFPIEMKFYTTGAKKGLVKEVVYDDSRIWSEVEVDKRVFKYSYKIKKGQVVKAVRKCTATYGHTPLLEGYTYSEEGMEVTKYKSEFTFKYTKKKADKKRCAAMINDIVANTGEFDPYGRPVLTTYWY